SKQPNKDIIQQLINSYFRQRFQNFNWVEEPLTTPKDFKDELRGDFKKEFKVGEETIKILIEVEFGNVASSYRDYFKFQLSYAYDYADICILIVPLDKLGKRIDSGVSNFEKTCKELPSAKLSITVPILVIGLDPEGEKEWDVKVLEPNLDILKNANKGVRSKHTKIIKDYIAKL
uniref:BglII/BstYI family type II restriction endonuclease n=1 Tax=Ornithinibacillus scapharcae TaxID=1147159 RepID=UPI000225B07C